jgi:hypothetical protein
MDSDFQISLPRMDYQDRDFIRPLWVSSHIGNAIHSERCELETSCVEDFLETAKTLVFIPNKVVAV